LGGWICIKVDTQKSRSVAEDRRGKKKKNDGEREREGGKERMKGD